MVSCIRIRKQFAIEQDAIETLGNIASSGSRELRSHSLEAVLIVFLCILCVKKQPPGKERHDAIVVGEWMRLDANRAEQPRS